jgi:hypothetical protein
LEDGQTAFVGDDCLFSIMVDRGRGQGWHEREIEDENGRVEEREFEEREVGEGKVEEGGDLVGWVERVRELRCPCSYVVINLGVV